MYYSTITLFCWCGALSGVRILVFVWQSFFRAATPLVYRLNVGFSQKMMGPFWALGSMVPKVSSHFEHK